MSSSLSVNQIPSLNNNHHSQSIAKNNAITGEKLEELFKAATDLIQNLPKNGN